MEGGQRVGEEVRAGALTQPVDHLFLAGGIAAGCAAERLAQSAGDDVDPIHHAAIFVGATTVFADKADGVGVIHHYQRIVFVRQIADGFEVGDDAIHGEDTVGGDQLEAGAIGVSLLELGFQLGHVVVGVAIALGLAQPHAVDDGGVVEGIGDDGIFGAEQGLEQAAIGIETGGVEDGVFGAEEGRHLLLQRFVLILGAADEAHRGHAEAVAVESLMGGSDQIRVVGQSQIVVGTEVQHLLTADGDAGLLGGGDDALLLVQPFSLHLVQLLGQVTIESVRHPRSLLAISAAYQQRATFYCNLLR